MHNDSMGADLCSLAYCSIRCERSHGRDLVDKKQIARALILILFITLIGGSLPITVVYVPQLTKLDSDGIPVDYYSRQCVIPLGMPVGVWLTALKWHRPYEENEWDCSTMSSYTEWAMENCGYRTEIVLVSLEGFGHAFVQIKIDGVWRIYEATIRKWFPMHGLIHPKMAFASIYRLYHFYLDDRGFQREWAWWVK